MKRAFITGITGQDGSYLADLLLSKGYEVHGTVRRSSSVNTSRIDHIFSQVKLHFSDLQDGSSMRGLIEEVQPHEVYNLAAQSHVRVSFDVPEYTMDVTGLGTLRLLEAIRQTDKSIRFYQASSSEMFGSSPAPQSESTPFHPRSPYGIAKLASHWTTVNYRESYDLFAVSGILFNHESPRRGETFVTRKIAKAVARIARYEQDFLYLGNLKARRDWGYAPDYVEAMWKMLQQDKPDDFVIATGERFSVEDFLSEAFNRVNRDWHDYIKIDPKYFRPAEVDDLCGDAAKANEVLDWHPQVGFDKLVRIMVDAERSAK